MGLSSDRLADPGASFLGPSASKVVALDRSARGFWATELQSGCLLTLGDRFWSKARTYKPLLREVLTPWATARQLWAEVAFSALVLEASKCRGSARLSCMGLDFRLRGPFKAIYFILTFSKIQALCPPPQSPRATKSGRCIAAPYGID